MNPGNAGEVSVFSVQFDNAGNLYVAGHANNAALPIVPLPGYWLAPAALQNTSGGTPGAYGDAFIMSWDPNNAFRYITYFGGASGPDSERIYTMLQRYTNDYVYFAGETSKDIAGGAPFLTTYFPLDEGTGPPAYFEYTYAGGARDAFVASLCMEFVTGVEPEVHGGPLAIWYDAQGQYYVTGLPTGQVSYSLVDAKGSSIAQDRIMVSEGQPSAIGSAVLANGLYIFRTELGSVKFVVQ